MKTTLLTAIVAAILCLGQPSTAFAQKKMEQRIAYTLRNMKLDRDTQKRFEPILRQYLTEKKAATKAYDDLKDKYKAAAKAGTLTNAQATQLLDAKFEAAAAELALKRKYRTEFARVLTAKQLWYAFDYVGDKKSKIEGKDDDSED